MGEALNYASWAPQGKSYSNYNDWLNAYNQAYASIGGSPTNNAYVGSENSLPNTYQYYVDHGGSYYKPDGTINTADPTVAASLLTGQGLYAASDADYANAQASKMANEDTGFGGMLDTLASNPASYAVLAAATAGLGGLADAGLAGTGADTTGGMAGATGLNAGGAMAGEEAAGGTGLSGLWSGLDPIIKQGLIGAGLGAGTSALTGGNIGQGALMGGLSGGIGGGITDLGGLTGIGNDIGGLVGDSTLGTDIGQGLSNIGNATGLSQLFGGTAAPTSDLSSGLNAINSTAPDLAATQGATAPVDFAPDGASSAYSAGAAAPGSTGMGGGSLSGFNAGGQMAEDTAVGSTMGGSLPWQAPDYVNPAASVAGDTATGYTPLSYGTPITGEGVGLAQQPSITEQFSNALSPSNNAGTFNFDAAGNAAGNSSYGIGQQFANGLQNGMGAATSGGSKMSGLSSLLGPLNGLINAGLSKATYDPNQAGANAINQATQQTQANYKPYYQAGVGAENTLSNLYGNNGADAQTQAMNGFQASPGYQFALNQGLNALNANNAAMGQTLSGNAQQGINNYAQGAASQQYNNYINQLNQLASGGMSAAGQMGNAGLTGANAQSQVYGNTANNNNTSMGMGLNALFPNGSFNLSQLLGGGNQNQGLLGMFS